MKNLLLIAALSLAHTAANAQVKRTVMAANTTATNWTLDKSHSGVKFAVDHLVISETEGTFKVFGGSLTSPAEDFNNAKVDFSVDVNSINTDDEKRDAHLKGDDFFSAEKYPQMKFTSTSFKKIKGNAYVMEGNLTIRDVTKKVKFAVIYGGTVKDPWGNTKAGFKASGKINRKDFGLKWGTVTEAGGAVVGDEVRMQINVEFAQAKG
ncbi:MAG TPA: YceI family protein [Flavipsychrobacter sp.]|nr:YceI family protein [Flavipsychrobacter sp.]